MALVVTVIGMRGAGKSSLGRAAASRLDAKFVDMDDALEASEDMSCGDIVAAHGWDGFRRKELTALRRTLEALDDAKGNGGHGVLSVVACGGGIVETEEARRFLKTLCPVVFVDRKIEDIVEYLESKEAAEARGNADKAQVAASELQARRPKYGESIQDVYARRFPHFVECSTHRFPIALGDTNWYRLCMEFGEFVRNLLFERTPCIFSPGSRLLGFREGLVEMQGCDGLWLESRDERDLVHVAAGIRKDFGAPLVVDAGSNAKVGAMAAKMLVDAVCVDDLATLRTILSRELHSNWVGKPWIGMKMKFDSLESARDIQAKAGQMLSANGALAVKMLIVTETFVNDPTEAMRLFCGMENLGIYCMIDESSCSGAGVHFAARLLEMRAGPRICNPTKGKEEKEDEYFRPEKLLCLVGGSIRSSPSPAMHNAGFRKLRASRKYTLCETLDLRRLHLVFGSPRFGGASVTMPHKENVVPMLDSLSDSAKQIGAVNTVTRLADGTLNGDNTDWWGLFKLARDGMAGKCGGSALVVGAGGTSLAAAYAVKQLNMKLHVWNRTAARVERLVKSFDAMQVTDLNAFAEPINLIISTVPASSKFMMPNEDFLTSQKPVVIDVAYRPRCTALLYQAIRCGCQTFEGIDMLVEQGLKQMSLWSEIELAQVPRLEMDLAARNFYCDTDPQCKRFYLFGNSIKSSPSPTLHNSGFHHLCLTYLYKLFETPRVEEIAAKIAERSFFGASVTIPHKESIMDFVDEFSPSAQAIKAVNTVVRKENGKLFGDNTDWLGIYRLLERSERLKENRKRALVLGAGGTALAACFCVKKLEMELVIWNRTASKAASLAQRFRGSALVDLDKADLEIDCVISTIPSSACLSLPSSILEHRPAVVDVSYRPRRTLLLETAASFGCETYEGIQMLIEQGLAQFSIFTGVQDPPRKVMETAVMSFYVE